MSAPRSQLSDRSEAEPAGHLADLAAALRAQIRLYQKLHAASLALAGAVRGRDAGAVSAAAAEQAQIAARLPEALTEARRALAALASRLGLPPTAGLGDVLDGLHVTDRWDAATPLRQLAEVLVGSVEDLREDNARNATLLRHALAYTNFALRTLTAAGTAAVGYTDTGAEHPRVRHLVDTRA